MDQDNMTVVLDARDRSDLKVYGPFDGDDPIFDACEWMIAAFGDDALDAEHLIISQVIAPEQVDTRRLRLQHIEHGDHAHHVLVSV